MRLHRHIVQQLVVMALAGLLAVIGGEYIHNKEVPYGKHADHYSI